MESQEFSQAGLFDSVGVIGVDHHCRRCGYNLRGLREDGVCPECGSPVGLSIRGDMLRFTDPNWVEKLAMGLKIILWMILAQVLVAIVMNFVSIQWTEIAFLVVSVVSYYGVWLLTEPEPNLVGVDTNMTARRIVRVSLIVGIGGSVLDMLPVESIIAIDLSTSYYVLIAVTGLISLAGEFAKFIYYEQLADRIPDPRLADRAQFLRWAYFISLLAAFCFGVGAALIFAQGQPGGGAVAVSCLVGIATIAVVIFGVMTLFLLLRLRKALAEQAKLARESWASAENGNLH